MDRFSVLRAGILLRFYGLKVSEYQYLVPWILYSIMTNAEQVVIPINRSYFLVAINYDIIEAFADRSAIDQVWIRSEINHLDQAKWGKFIKMAISQQDNGLRISDRIIAEMFRYREQCIVLIQTIEVVYTAYWSNSIYANEIRLLQNLCNSNLSGLRDRKSVV